MLLNISQLKLDMFCYYCIDLLYNLGDVLGLSYAGINILLFVIIQPLLILAFGIIAIIGMHLKNNKYKIIIKSIIITILLLCILFGSMCIAGYVVVDKCNLEFKAEEYPLKK